MKHVSVVLLGNKGCGKSTLCGRILYRYGGIDDKKFKKAKDATKKYNKPNSEFAFLCDEKDLDRKNGTQGTHLLRFILGSQEYTLIDTCSGEQNHNRLLHDGLGQSQIGILILESYKDKNTFNALIDNKSNIYKYLIISHTFGIKQLIICINKIDKDASLCDEQLYKEYCKNIQNMLTSIGYNKNKIPIIPICSYNGDNLFSISNDPSLNWWKGFQIKTHKITTLIKGIKYLNKKVKPLNNINISLPLVMNIKSKMEINKVGTVFLSRIEQGQLKLNQIVLCCKSRDDMLCNKYTIKSMQMHCKDIKIANIGNIIGFTLNGMDNIEDKDKPQVGDIICSVNKMKMNLIEDIYKHNKNEIDYMETVPKCVTYVKRFMALIIILKEDVAEKQILQLNGKFQLVFRTQTIENCELKKIIVKCKKKDENMEIIEQKNELTNGEQGEVMFMMNKRNFVSSYDLINTFGRFVIMKNKVPIAIGKVLGVNE